MEGIVRNKDTFHSFFRLKTKKIDMVKAALSFVVALVTIGLQVYSAIDSGKAFKKAKKEGDVWGL